MVFEHIEKLKRDYTDKYVVVDGSRPELARFQGSAGRVQTVNMNGKALVEFPEHANIGWYDIDVDFLKVVDRPVPKTEEKKTAAPKKKPVAKAADAATQGKKLSPLELARMQGAAGATKDAPEKKAKGGDKPKGKMSTGDVLAAARGTAAVKEASAEKASQTAPAKDPAQMSVADKIAMLRGEKSAEPSEAKSKTASADPAVSQPAKDPSQMTLQEKLAAMRGEKSGGVAGGEAAAQEQTSEPPSAEDAPMEASASAAAPAETAGGGSGNGGSGETVDRGSMNVGDIIAWCRLHDAG